MQLINLQLIRTYRVLCRSVALGLSATTVTAICLGVTTAKAQEVDDRWGQLRTAFESGARHGTAWNIGWGSVYGASLAHSVYTHEDSSEPEDRFDARVSAVKSALALVDTYLDPQPHARALDRFKGLAAQGDAEALEQAERLRAEIAAEERSRRQLDARFRPLLTNLLGGLVIAIGDDRPKDGAINFATGMLVTELAIWTQPSAASQLGAASGDLSLHIGNARVDAAFRWLASPDHVALVVRF